MTSEVGPFEFSMDTEVLKHLSLVFDATVSFVKQELQSWSTESTNMCIYVFQIQLDGTVASHIQKVI